MRPDASLHSPPHLICCCGFLSLVVSDAWPAAINEPRPPSLYLILRAADTCIGMEGRGGCKYLLDVQRRNSIWRGPCGPRCGHTSGPSPGRRTRTYPFQGRKIHHTLKSVIPRAAETLRTTATSFGGSITSRSESAHPEHFMRTCATSSCGPQWAHFMAQSSTRPSGRVPSA